MGWWLGDGGLSGKVGTISLIRETAEPGSPEAWGSRASCSLIPSVLSSCRVEAGVGLPLHRHMLG